MGAARENQRSRGFVAVIASGVILVALGVLLFVSAGVTFRQEVINAQDELLERLAVSVDSNLKSVLNGCEQSLGYSINQEEFLEAEERWRNGEGTDALRRSMARCYAMNDETAFAMLALVNGACVESTTGKKGYLFPNGLDGDGGKLVISEDEELFLAYVSTSKSSDIQYALLLDLDEVYLSTAGSDLKSDEQLYLMDARSSLMICGYEGAPQVFFVGLEETPESELPAQELLLSAQEKGSIQARTFDYDDAEGSFSCHALALPASKTENETLAVCVTLNVDTAAAPLQTKTLSLGVYLLMAFSGIALLVGALVNAGRRRQADAREIEELQKRADAMKELAEATQQMAHHQRLESIGTLTAGIAHEFNNTLTPVMGYSLMALEQAGDDPALVDPLVEIYSASKRAKDMIGKLQILSHGPSDAAFTVLDVRAQVERALGLVDSSRPDSVSVRNDVAESCFVMGSQSEFLQVLVNLSINAFQAMEPEGGELRVDLRRNGEEAVLRFTDSGPGMTDDIRNQVFDPFFTTKPVGQGTGLGLAIAKQIVGNMGGDLAVSEAETGGCVFEIRLSVVELERAQEEAASRINSD